MGLRFQRRVTLFPGVRLNFSRRGISTVLSVFLVVWADSATNRF